MFTVSQLAFQHLACWQMLIQEVFLQCWVCRSTLTFYRRCFQSAADGLHVSVSVLNLVDGLCAAQLHQVPQFQQGHPKLPIMVALCNRIPRRVVSHIVGHGSVERLATVASPTAPVWVSQSWFRGNAGSSALTGESGWNGRLAPARGQHAPQRLPFKGGNWHFLAPVEWTETGKTDFSAKEPAANSPNYGRERNYRILRIINHTFFHSLSGGASCTPKGLIC